MFTYDSSLYERTQNLQGLLFQSGMALLGPQTPPTPPLLLQLRRGLAESPAWFLVQAAEFEPEPLSVERIRVRAIWSSERIVSAILELMASEKWLDRRGEDYYLTAEGQRLKTQLIERPTNIMRLLPEAIRQTDVNRFESLMAKIITRSLEYPDPPGNWSLAHSRRRAPAESASPFVKIFQYCADFNAFRDDSHMAAWRPYQVSGLVWETFSYVISGVATSADEMFEQFSYRGYALEGYTHALSDLTERGWIFGKGSHYQPTEQGRSVSAEVEQRTDSYFYAPWHTRSDAELDEFHQLFDQLETELQAVQEAQASPK